MPGENRPWRLQSFLDSLVVELDRAQDTLAIKAVNRPLSYSVKDVSLDLQIFPSFDGKEVRFVTAGADQTGASRISLQLGSISDRMMRETTRAVAEDDVPLAEVEGLEEEVRTTLEKVGVKSAKDLERIKDRKIELGRVAGRKVEYGNLARLINRARRAPAISSVELSGDGARLRLRGHNLDALDIAPGFPAALLDGEPAEVASAAPSELHISAEPARLRRARALAVALDPFRVIELRLQQEGAGS
jgi:hypothetical protein